MVKEDLERFLGAIQSSTEEIPNGKDEWGETEYIKVVDADALEREIKSWIDEVTIMTKDIAIESFRKVYPESEVNIQSCELLNNKGIICAEFPDSNEPFYFVVTASSVSSAYSSLESAKKGIEKE